MRRIAVIIPAYNAEATIEEALDCALRQSRAPDEILVVDDGSRDDTARLVEAYCRRDRRIRLLRQANGGPAAARNRAIAETDADFVAPLDADDLWDLAYLETLVGALERAPDAGFAYCRHRIVDAQGKPIRDANPPIMSGGIFGPLLLVNMVGHGSAAVFNRTALVHAGGYEAPIPGSFLAEDYLLQLRIAAVSPAIGIDHVLSSYRASSGSISRDVEAARAARIAAVRLALAEYGPCPLPALTWSTADADRVFAAQSLMRGEKLLASKTASRAATADPAGTASDLARRVSNFVMRRLGITIPVGRADPLLRSRAHRLQAAMPFGRQYRGERVSSDTSARPEFGRASLRSARSPVAENTAHAPSAR